MTNKRLYLLSINGDGYGVAVEPKESEPDKDECRSQRQWDVWTVEWFDHLTSLPKILVHLSLASTLKAGEWFEDWKEGYEWLWPDDIGTSWSLCTKEQYEIGGAYSARKVLVRNVPSTQSLNIDQLPVEGEAYLHPQSPLEYGNRKSQPKLPPVSVDTPDLQTVSKEGEEHEKIFKQEAKSIMLEHKINEWVESQSKNMKVGERYTYPEVCELMQCFIETQLPATPRTEDDQKIISEKEQECERLREHLRTASYSIWKGCESQLTFDEWRSNWIKMNDL